MSPTSSATLRASLLSGAVAALSLPAPAFAQAKTPAGTSIANTATASYDGVDGGPRETVDSNTVTIRVDELVDVVVSSATEPVAVVAGSTRQVTRFTLTNSGNGPEAYRLTATGVLPGDDFDPTNTTLVIDDGDGVYQEGVDLAYTPGGNDPTLTPDQSRIVFVLSNIPAGATQGQTGRVQLTAAATTGIGAPGSVVAGGGANGTDAVFGPNGGDDAAVAVYRVSANRATVQLVKAQSVADPFGGTRVVPGSIVTYTLTATVNGGGSLANLAISDRVPAGSTYVPGSITLGGAVRTDATDGDEARFDGQAVTVTLGTVPASETRTVGFQVKID